MIPIDTPYNRPPFEDLDLSLMGKIPPQTPKPNAFLLGLHPIIDNKGDISHLAISGMSELLPINNFNDIAELLCSEHGKFFSYVVYYRHTIDCILKTLPLDILKRLQENGQARYEGMHIWYTPNHKITIQKGDEEARIQVLENWSKRLDLFKALRRAKIRFSIDDPLSLASGLKELGTLIQDKSESLLNRRWGDISSPSALTKHILRKDITKTAVTSIPIEALNMAYDCLHAPWVEMLAQGYWSNVYDYDLNSAYPTEIAKLINCDSRTGTWIQKDEYVKEAEYGYCLAVLDIFPILGGASPIRFRKNTGMLFSPYGMWVGYITKSEIDFIRKWKLGKVDILNGWWYIPKVRILLFQKTVDTLVEIRKRGDPVLAAMMKSAANRINGHFLQKYQKLDGSWTAGPMFNPIYACEVMTRTKLKLAEIALEAVRSGGQILTLTVDGVTTTRPIGADSERKLVVNSPALVIAPLVMWLEDRQSSLSILNKLWSDPDNYKYTFAENKRITLCEGIIMKDSSRIGEESKHAPTITVGDDVSRIWTNIPLTGRDLLKKHYFSKQPPIEYVTMGGGER